MGIFGKERQLSIPSPPSGYNRRMEEGFFGDESTSIPAERIERLIQARREKSAGQIKQPLPRIIDHQEMTDEQFGCIVLRELSSH